MLPIEGSCSSVTQDSNLRRVISGSSHALSGTLIFLKDDPRMSRQRSMRRLTGKRTFPSDVMGRIPSTTLGMVPGLGHSFSWAAENSKSTELRRLINKLTTQ